MYLRDLMRSLARRWYFLIVGLVVTAGLAIAAFRVIPVSYDSQASLVLLPPKTSTQTVGNPFLLLGGLSQAVDILTRTVQSDEVSAALLDANPGAKFTIDADRSTTGPIILITSTAPTAAESLAMTADVAAAVPTSLTELQSSLSVPNNSRIGVMTLTVDEKGTLDAKTRTEAVLGITAVGIVLSVFLIGLIDGLLRSRRRRGVRVSERPVVSTTTEDSAPALDRATTAEGERERSPGDREAEPAMDDDDHRSRAVVE
ncbi:hypothetical protein [Glaciihabitans sp. dw_435]|uniref:hypothetical protein n=1 Tax=Glaciihabitans sp. dw_435 TaxID=2720081 RepID=UPI001BD67913|nr:hypothetical protein [Glaciihabitans sp. dw_435]